MRKKRILFITYKATSEMDFIIPILWKTANMSIDTQIDILYCVLNKKMILRKAKLYSNVIKDCNVKEYDFIEFLGGVLNPFSKIVRSLFSFSYWDLTSKRFTNKNIITNILGFGIDVFRKSIRVIERFVLLNINFEKMFNYFSPDIVFFPPRDYTFYGKKQFYDYTYKNKPTVILYPHSPFPSTGRYNISFGSEKLNDGNIIPNFCEYWYSFKEELTPHYSPILEKQSFYTGYPGMDSKWYNYLKKKHTCKKDLDAMTCLFITRRFVFQKPNDGTTDYIFVDELMDQINNTIKSLQKYENIKLIIKPHPQNDFRSIEKIMENTGYKNWAVTYEPIYAVLPITDFVVSISSGIITLPYVFGKPVILINSTAKKLFEKWSVMVDLFKEPSFFVKDVTDLENIIDKIVDNFSNAQILYKDIEINKKVEYDTNHFRKYFPDNNLELIENRIKKIIQ